MIRMKLDAARKNAGLTQRQVVEHTSFGLNMLVWFENGERIPTKEQVLELCKIYKCSLADLDCKYVSVLKA